MSDATGEATTNVAQAAATISLRDLVEQAVKAEWSAFEAEHPRLAAVLDREMLITGASAALDEDEEYRQALAAAGAAGIAAEALGGVVRTVVGKWVRGLIG